jgi:hypothetical protein
MSKKKLAVSVAFLSIFTTNVMANECPKNFQEATVTGTVNTQNVTADMQVGTIHMQLTSVKKGKLLFDQLGAVVGQITDQGIDPLTGLPFAYLDHDITFAGKVEIETNGDLATIYGDPTTGSPVPVVEVINNFQGTKTFNKATGAIIATGQLNSSFESDGNGGYSTYNSFLLSGSLCIKD